MTYYTRELERIRQLCFSNEVQLEVAVKSKRYIDRHFDTEIDLDLLAQSCCASKYHLIRMFRKYWGITPRQYLISKRMEKAREYLRSGQSVSDTCFAVGFDSISSFSTLFKEKTGVPPSVFRKATFDKSKT